MILAQDKIRAQLNVWRDRLEFEAGTHANEAIDEVAKKVAGIFEKAEEERKSGKEVKSDKAYYESILVYPFPEDQMHREGPSTGPSLHGVVCELTLGEDVFLTTDKVPRKLSYGSGGYEGSGSYLTIRPGEFAVLTTQEFLYLPRKVMGLISMRNSYKQKGLISVSGFHVDPGFRGKLVFTTFNSGPREVVLRLGERLFMIAFAEVSGEAEPYWELQMDIPMATVSQLHGKSLSLNTLSDRIDKIQFLLEIVLAPLTVGLIVALISVLLR